MSKRKRKDEPDRRSFVQVAQHPSLGVEVSSGRPWVGVDQQVGHGSADALYALTDDQYAVALVNAWEIREFEGECWRGDHNDLCLHSPGGGSWRPDHWYASRTRMLPPAITGEIWHHIDALGEEVASERAVISRDLAAESAHVTSDSHGISRLAFTLVGEAAYPRPAGLIAGLTTGSTREQARAVLGESAGTDDHFTLEGDLLHLTFLDGGLTEIAIASPPPSPPPQGAFAPFLAVLGAPEEGAAFKAIAALGGQSRRRWAASSGLSRRLIAFADGIELQVEDDVVLSARVALAPRSEGPAYSRAADLFLGQDWPPSRGTVNQVFGAPVASTALLALHRYGPHDLLVEYNASGDTSAATSLTFVRHGRTVSHGFRRWRSGEFTTFLDVLGRPATNPLVAHVRNLPGTKLAFRHDLVTAVEIGGRGYQSERFAAFVDGMTGDPDRTGLLFGVPHDTGEHDDLRYFDQGCIHVHSNDGTRISTITVSQEPPRGVEIHRWMPHRDR